MSSRKSKREKPSPAEISRLRNDPDFLAHQAEIKPIVEEERRVAAPIVDELQAAGYAVDSIDELVDRLRETGAKYVSAVPILVFWLPRISNTGVKESIVRTLSVPWAKEAARVLIEEFRNSPETPPSDFKWAVGNALSVVADKTVLSELIELASDKRHGKDREMVALAMGNIREKRAVEVLIRLLDDERVAQHSIMALRKLNAKEAAPHVGRFLTHPNTYVRKEAEKALKKFAGSKSR